jgi:hypothetical protein
MPLIPATLEAKMERIEVPDQPVQNVSENPTSTNKLALIPCGRHR